MHLSLLSFKHLGYCQIWGDPHYMTFDEVKYNFQGDCDYTLVRDCLNSSLFHLWSNNELRRPSDRVSYLREVVFELNGNTYTPHQGVPDQGQRH